MSRVSELKSRVSSTLQHVFDLESSGRVLVYSAIVGVVAGLGAAGFFWVLQRLTDFAQWGLMGYAPPAAGEEPAAHLASLPTCPWAVVLVPTIGGLLCGILVYTFAPEAEGHGTDGLINAFHRMGGRIRSRVPIVKTIASILTIGTGGSAGREGPIAQIGAGFGSLLADRIRLSEHERRVLMLAGAAGGVGAMFQAPLGGALFAVEVLYSSTAIEFMALVPCVVSSVIAYCTFRSLFGEMVALTVPENLHFEGPAELPFFLAFAIPCAAVGFLYVWFFYGLRDKLFHRLPIPNFIKPAIGGAILGCIALALPQVMSGGYGYIQQAIDGALEMPIQLMLLLIFAKIAATSFTISSGGSGGVFAPSLFIGAMLGGVFGKLCQTFFGDVAPEPAAFVLVGMGGFFAGVAKVPLTSLIIISEMTHSYDLLVPLMLVSVIHVAVLSARWSLYEEQVRSLVDSPAHLGEFIVDVLEDIHVRDLPDTGRNLVRVREETPLVEVLDLVANSQEEYFPVVDQHDNLVGIFTLSDIRSEFINQLPPGTLIRASDFARSPVVTVTPDDNLHTTLQLCTREKIAEIPVVETENRLKIIRMLRRQEVLAAYDEQMSAVRG